MSIDQGKVRMKATQIALMLPIMTSVLVSCVMRMEQPIVQPTKTDSGVTQQTPTGPVTIPRASPSVILTSEVVESATLPFSLATQTPDSGVKQDCLYIRPELQDRKEFSGTIAFENFGPISESNGRLSFYNLEKEEFVTKIEQGSHLVVSPDRTRYAFHNYSTDQLEIFTFDGNKIRSFMWEKSWGWVEQWIGDQTISIVMAEEESPTSIYLRYPPAVIFIDIQTGQTKTWKPDYPKIDTEVFINIWPWKPYSITVYHPDMSRVVYLSPYKGEGVVLYDIQKEKRLGSIENCDFQGNPPIWSPSGKRFIVACYDDFYLMSDQGEISRITHLNPDSDVPSRTSRRYEIMFYRWAPDSRHVAFWLKAADTNLLTLSILDADTGEVTDFCIPAGFDPSYNQIYPALAWSPDGQQLVVSANYRSEDHGNDVILVDLESRIAYKLSENNNPVGWLISP